jgi:hypothetical protein
VAGLRGLAPQVKRRELCRIARRQAGCSRQLPVTLGDFSPAALCRLAGGGISPLSFMFTPTQVGIDEGFRTPHDWTM